MVVCKVMQCPYCVEDFCSKEVTIINEGGGCDFVYKFANNVLNTRPNWTDPVDLKLKKMPIIVEGSSNVQENTENITT